MSCLGRHSKANRITPSHILAGGADRFTFLQEIQHIINQRGPAAAARNRGFQWEHTFTFIKDAILELKLPVPPSTKRVGAAADNNEVVVDKPYYASENVALLMEVVSEFALQLGWRWRRCIDAPLERCWLFPSQEAEIVYFRDLENLKQIGQENAHAVAIVSGDRRRGTLMSRALWEQQQKALSSSSLDA